MNRTSEPLIGEPDGNPLDLSARLDVSAELMPLNPDALSDVHTRAASSRSAPYRLLVACAAATVVVALAVGIVGRDATPLEVDSASGDAGASSSPSDSGTSPVPSDGVLVVYDYPNSDDPDLAGEWMTLTTPNWTYQWRGSPDTLPRADTDREETGTARLLTIVDSTGYSPADAAIEAIAEAAAGAPLSELGDNDRPWGDIDRARYVYLTLGRVLESGLASPEQASRLLELLGSVPDVELLEFDDHLVKVTFVPDGGIITIDAKSARPVNSSYTDDTSTLKRYISVTPVVSDKVLTAGVSPSDLSTTSTISPPTSVDGNEPR